MAFENAAITGVDGRAPSTTFPRRGPPIGSAAIGSLSRVLVEETIAEAGNSLPEVSASLLHMESSIERTEVPSLTFESLCRKHGIGELDLLLIDAEGYDYEIIKGIDFERHRPRLLIYESILFSGDERAETRPIWRDLATR